MTIERRQFLGHMAAGSAILTMPGFLSGCGVNQATRMAAATPSLDPHRQVQLPFGHPRWPPAWLSPASTDRRCCAGKLYVSYRISHLWLDDPLVAEPQVTAVVPGSRAIYTLAALAERFCRSDDKPTAHLLPIDVDFPLAADVTSEFAQSSIGFAECNRNCRLRIRCDRFPRLNACYWQWHARSFGSKLTYVAE